MKVFLAYILVIVLVQFCLTIGTLVVGFPIALCLAWLPAHIRSPISGTLAGIGGVIAAVVIGYCAFTLIAGTDSFGIGAFLASTVPLAIPIINDRRHALQLSEAQQQLPVALQSEAAATTDAARYSVVGYILGLVLAVLWFFLLHNNAA